MGANEFKTVGLIRVDYRVEQLKLGMFNIINLQALEQLRRNIEMVHHRYPTRASHLACVTPLAKGSGQTSFFYTHICHWNNLPIELIQCKSKTSFRKK